MTTPSLPIIDLAALKGTPAARSQMLTQLGQAAREVGFFYLVGHDLSESARQETLALAHLTMEPAPETRRKAVADVTVDALRSFEARAKLIADTLGRRYRIAHLTVGDHGLQPPPMPRMRAAVMAAEAAPAPLEGGESRVSVHVSGRIELLD